MKYILPALSLAAACALSISLSAQARPTDLYAGVVVSKGLQKRETRRPPVIVVLTIDDNVEFSNRLYQDVLEQLDKSRAALHVVSLGTPGSSQSDEARNRNQVIALGTERTGGRRDNV